MTKPDTKLSHICTFLCLKFTSPSPRRSPEPSPRCLLSESEEVRKARPSTTRLILNNALFGEEEEAVEAEQKLIHCRRCYPIALSRFPQQSAPPSALIRTGLINFQIQIVSKVLKQST